MGCTRGWLRRILAAVRGDGAQGYQRGVMRRYLREQEAWAGHIQNTEREVLRFAERTGAHSLVVLGSGWLIDFPMEALLAKGVGLTLCDIAHPPQVYARWKDDPRVQFVTIDVTGGLHALLQAPRRRTPSWQELVAECSQLSLPASLDFSQAVVSLNLLSQLPYPVIDRYDGTMAPEGVSNIARVLQEAHLRLLERFAAALLITDVEERHTPFHTSGTPCRVPTVEVDLSAGAPLAEWEWRFDETGNYRPGYCVSLWVRAMEWGSAGA